MHYIKELVHDRTIILQYYSSDEHIANIFTKRRKEVHLPLFTVGGEFISVIHTTFSVQLEGGFFPLGFPSSPHLVCFEYCFSFNIVQGDLWP